MTFTIPLATLLALSATAQAPGGGSKGAAITPFLGEEVAAAIHVNLGRWEVPATSRRVLGKLADEPDVAGFAAALDRWVEGLKKAGASDLYLLFDVTDMPGYPLVVVPLAAGAD